jgi:hypothetical protein
MADPEEAIEAGIEGRHARREGLTRSACPFPVGTAVGNAWLREWNREDLRQSNGSSTQAAVSA